MISLAPLALTYHSPSNCPIPSSILLHFLRLLMRMPRSMPRMPRWLAPCKDPNSPNPGKETIPNPPLWLLTLIVIRWSSSRVHSKRKRFKISWVVEIFRFWAHFQGRSLLTNSICLHNTLLNFLPAKMTLSRFERYWTRKPSVQS